ncbi:MAG: FecR domain-containing protein [Burkholderiaceae bacterium]
MSAKSGPNAGHAVDATAHAAIEAAIDPAVVQRASEWMARLWSGEASADDIAGCEAWRAAHPDHERAWSRLQALDDQLGSRIGALPASTARRVLLEPAPSSRRRIVRMLSALAVLGGAAYTVRGTDAWQLATAEYTAGTGQIRDLDLPDGTRVALDTASAIDVRYTDDERRIVLHTGRILVATAPDPLPTHRPLLVECAQGTVRALGTRFEVGRAQTPDMARVAVYEGALEIRLGRAAEAAPLRLDAGWQTDISSEAIRPVRPARDADTAWTRGLLIAERMRVADLVAELARYRRGVLRCDDSAAELRVTGVFPLLDTDRALANLMVGMPVDVRYRTRYWATVHAR